MKLRRGTRAGASVTVMLSSLGLVQGDPLTVPPNLTVVIDTDTPGTGLGAIDINGTLKGDGNTRNFTADYIVVETGGALEIGTEAVPYPQASTFTLTLKGAYVPLTLTTINSFATATNPGISRSIMVMPGGRCDLHGVRPATPYALLNANAAAAATSLTLDRSPGWASGDPVVVSPTDFVEYGQAEQFTLNGATSGTSATLSAGLATSKYGSLQYPTDTGLSLTPGTFSTMKGSVDVPTVIDQRALVVNLKSNVIVQAPNDTDWSTKFHGVTIMGMATHGASHCTLRVEGIQIRRGGQGGAIGRYPVHWHLLSYNTSTGAFTSDVVAANNYAKKCVSWDSVNRAFTIHATCGVEVSDCVAYLTKGHAFFLEDGSERRNTLKRNIALDYRCPQTPQAMPGTRVSVTGNGTTTSVNWTSHGLYSGETVNVSGVSGGTGSFNVTRSPVTVVDANNFTYASTGNGTGTGGTFTHGDNRIKVHDNETSGYWITNVDNTIEDNYGIGGSTGHGMWISLGNQCFGFSALVSVVPKSFDPLSLKGTDGRANKGHGLKAQGEILDEAGNTGSSSGAKPGLTSFLSTDHKLFKNSTGAYGNNINIPTYLRWTVADNGNYEWAGSTNNGGVSRDHLCCSRTNNSASGNSTLGGFTGSHNRETDDLQGNGGFFDRAAFVTYHGTVVFQNNSFFEYLYAAPKYQFNASMGAGGGMHPGGADFYDVAGIDTTMGANSGNKLFNTHPGPMMPPIHLDGRNIDANSGAQRHWAHAQVWFDTDGKYGTAGKYMLPITPGTGLVDNYYLTNAAGLADGPTSGTVVCKTTTSKFIGIGWSDVGSINVKYAGTPVNGNLNSSGFYIGRNNPLRVTRQDSGGATIGTPFQCKRGDTSISFGGYHTTALMYGERYLVEQAEENVGITMTIASPCVVTWTGNGGTGNHGLAVNNRVRFSTTGALPTGVTAGVDYFVTATPSGNTFRFSATSGGADVNTSGTQSGTHSGRFENDYPDSMLLVDLYAASSSETAQGDFVLLGLPWANGATPAKGVAVGGSFSSDAEATFNNGTGATGRNTWPSAGDTSGSAAYIATAGANLAAVLADTTGKTYWQDTTNNTIWVRFTNRNNGGTAKLTATGVVFGIQRLTIVVK